MRSGLVSAMEGVLREAARGDALEVQRWYFKLQKDALRQARKQGVSAEKILDKALLDLSAEKAVMYKDIVRRLSAPSGVLEEVNEWLRNSSPDLLKSSQRKKIVSLIKDVLREAAAGNNSELERFYFTLQQVAEEQASKEGVTVKYVVDRALADFPGETALRYRDIINEQSTLEAVPKEKIHTRDQQHLGILTTTSEALGGDSWEEWLEVFKQQAAHINPQLAPNEKGTSLLDFMDLKPLMRAYADNVDPKVVAKGFAAQFDIKTFGL